MSAYSIARRLCRWLVPEMTLVNCHQYHELLKVHGRASQFVIASRMSHPDVEEAFEALNSMITNFAAEAKP